MGICNVFMKRSPEKIYLDYILSGSVYQLCYIIEPDGLKWLGSDYIKSYNTDNDMKV